MEYKRRFPLMGFPKETNKRDGDIIYQCWFEGGRIALWQEPPTKNYALNIYRLRFTDESQSHVQDRLCSTQPPIRVNDAFEAQLAIFYLVQTYLPTEVTHDVSEAYKEDPCAANLAAGQDGDVRTHPRTS